MLKNFTVLSKFWFLCACLCKHRVLKLSSDQKYELASHELEQLKEEQAKRKEEFERAWDNHSAVVEEADIQLAEIKKSYYEFDRDIVRGAINPVSCTVQC